jgi:hypothetical protein
MSPVALTDFRQTIDAICGMAAMIAAAAKIPADR